MLSLDELRALGVTVVVCKPSKAKGVRKQVMRGKGGSSYVIGGSKPKGYTQSAY
jgi:hypothetical protein